MSDAWERIAGKVNAKHVRTRQAKWWKIRAIDPIAHAERLWVKTRGQDVAISVETRELVRMAPAYADEPEL